MSLPVKEPVRQVVGADYRHRAEAGNVLAGAGEAEDRPRQRLLAGRTLRRAGCRLVGLRIVDQNKIRPDRPAVGAGVPQAADAACDAGDTDGGPRADPAGDGCQRDLVGVPLDLRGLPVDGLPASPLVDPLEGADRVGRVWEVVRQEVVLL